MWRRGRFLYHRRRTQATAGEMRQAMDVEGSRSTELAAIYDAIYAGRDDTAFWLTMAAAADGGPVLELGCGTGRVLLPLARAGYEITGLDLSAPMLDRCRAKVDAQPPEVRERVRLVLGDMTSFDLGGGFAAITVPVRRLPAAAHGGAAARLPGALPRPPAAARQTRARPAQSGSGAGLLRTRRGDGRGRDRAGGRVDGRTADPLVDDRGRLRSPASGQRVRGDLRDHRRRRRGAADQRGDLAALHLPLRARAPARACRLPPRRPSRRLRPFAVRGWDRPR